MFSRKFVKTMRLDSWKKCFRQANPERICRVRVKTDFFYSIKLLHWLVSGDVERDFRHVIIRFVENCTWKDATAGGERPWNSPAERDFLRRKVRRARQIHWEDKERLILSGRSWAERGAGGYEQKGERKSERQQQHDRQREREREKKRKKLFSRATGC